MNTLTHNFNTPVWLVCILCAHSPRATHNPLDLMWEWSDLWITSNSFPQYGMWSAFLFVSETSSRVLFRSSFFFLYGRLDYFKLTCADQSFSSGDQMSVISNPPNNRSSYSPKYKLCYSLTAGPPCVDLSYYIWRLWHILFYHELPSEIWHWFRSCPERDAWQIFYYPPP